MFNMSSFFSNGIQQTIMSFVAISFQIVRHPKLYMYLFFYYWTKSALLVTLQVSGLIGAGVAVLGPLVNCRKTNRGKEWLIQKCMVTQFLFNI